MRKLIVITGPTASGKTGLAIEAARRVGCDIISADSRQIYQGIPICTATPTASQLEAVKHHFVAEIPLTETYSAARYETDVLTLLPKLWEKNEVQIMCGGSMMYIDAVCHGIDDLPTIDEDLRKEVMKIYTDNGIEEIRRRLKALDPVSYERIDPQNPRRNIHALEICLQSGKPCSTLLTGKKKERDFTFQKFYIDLPREILFDRINRRVDKMMEDGLEEEARKVYEHRHLNSLNTVGLKEMFAFFDGIFDYDTAVARLKKNTRVYAKKQMTWIKRDTEAVAIQNLEDLFRHLK